MSNLAYGSIVEYQYTTFASALQNSNLDILKIWLIFGRQTFLNLKCILVSGGMIFAFSMSWEAQEATMLSLVYHNHSGAERQFVL